MKNADFEGPRRDRHRRGARARTRGRASGCYERGASVAVNVRDIDRAEEVARIARRARVRRAG